MAARVSNFFRTMTNVCLVTATSAFLTSCCNPPDPFLAESAKEWIGPFESENQKFISTGTVAVEQNIIKEYEEGVECIGGDECCANNPTHTAGFLFDTGAMNGWALLYTKAIQNETIFSAQPDIYSQDVHLALFDATTGSFSKASGIDLIETD